MTEHFCYILCFFLELPHFCPNTPGIIGITSALTHRIVAFSPFFPFPIVMIFDKCHNNMV